MKGRPSTTRGTVSPIVMDGQALIRLYGARWLAGVANAKDPPSARHTLQNHPIHLLVLHLVGAQRQPRAFVALGQISATARGSYESRRQVSRRVQYHLAAPLPVSMTSCRRPSGLRRTTAVGVSSQEDLGAVLSGRIKIAETESLLLVPHTQISTLSVARALLHTVWLPGV